MANAPVARQLGDDYQARIFWFHACRLFLPHERVSRVGFEADDPLGFDDVFVTYSSPQPDGCGGKVNRDYFQSKFHVAQTGSFRYESLASPGFINTQSSSILQRLKNAREWAQTQGVKCRYFLVSPWPVHPDDPLADLHDHITDRLRLDQLSKGATTGSRMGRVRAFWKEHLDLATDEELCEVLRLFRLSAGSLSFDGLRAALNDRFMSAGLRPIPNDQIGFPYDDILRKSFIHDVREFDRDSLQELAQQEGLWVGTPVQDEGRPKVIAVRSFTKWTQQVADSADEFLDLADSFRGRYIKDDSSWADCVYPRLKNFLDQVVEDDSPAFELHLDTHTSIAFAAGRVLAKVPASVTPVQRTGPSATLRWNPAKPDQSGDQDIWCCEVKSLEAGDPHQHAVAISVTHDVWDDVEAFLTKTKSSVGKVLHMTPASGVGRTAVKDGAHAWALAESLTRRIRQERRDREPGSPLHVFASAPNGLIFFMGQHSQAWGDCLLYEYDFENAALGAYMPALSIGATASSNQAAELEDSIQ